MNLRAALAAIPLVLIAACSSTADDAAGPLISPEPMFQDAYVVPAGRTVSYGGFYLMNDLQGRTYTVLDAHAVIDGEVSAVSARAAQWDLSDGAFGLNDWSETLPVKGSKRPLSQLPLDVPGRIDNQDGSALVLFARIPVGPATTTLDGFRIKYTDGTSTWDAFAPATARICTTGTAEACREGLSSAAGESD